MPVLAANGMQTIPHTVVIMLVLWEVQTTTAVFVEEDQFCQGILLDAKTHQIGRTPLAMDAIGIIQVLTRDALKVMILLVQWAVQKITAVYVEEGQIHHR